MQDHVAQCRFLLRQAERAFEGLGDEHRAVQPAVGTKTAGWLVGHLSVTGDFGRRLCGRKPICPKEWRAAFNPGTTPSAQAGDYPPMAELIGNFRAVYADLCAAALAADAQMLAVENPFEPARKDYPTAGVFVQYMMTGHLAWHLGQLVGWRGAAGLGRLENKSELAI